MQGFIVLDHFKDAPEAVKQLATWLAEGKLQRKETIVRGGLKEAEKAMLHLFEGKNTGKLLVEVKNPDEASKL
jgi:NADPH-dependent curcumin reductase CurA